MNNYTGKSAKYKKSYREKLEYLYGTPQEGVNLSEVKSSPKNAARVACRSKIEPSVNLDGLKQGKKRDYPESREQIKYIAWLRGKGIWCFASLNGEKRSRIKGARLKALGMSSGFPDVGVLIPKGIYHGLFIEMKPIEGGKVQKNQLAWQAYLRSQGYMCEVAHGFAQAKEITLKYLSL